MIPTNRPTQMSMPPLPSGPTISYPPSFVPGVKVMFLAGLYAIPRTESEFYKLRSASVPKCQLRVPPDAGVFSQDL